MAYHRDHVTRFIAASSMSVEDGTKIKERAETAIAEFSDKKEGLFSGGKLSEVIGSPELVGKFHNLWESGQLGR